MRALFGVTGFPFLVLVDLELEDSGVRLGVLRVGVWPTVCFFVFCFFALGSTLLGEIYSSFLLTG